MLACLRESRTGVLTRIGNIKNLLGIELVPGDGVSTPNSQLIRGVCVPSRPRFRLDKLWIIRKEPISLKGLNILQ